MRITPLSNKNLEEAIKVASRVFPDRTEKRWVKTWFTASLDPKNNKKLYARYGTEEANYWVALENKKVVGTTGLYTYKDEKDTIWLGWFCVDPEHRGKRVGSKLLDFSIRKAKAEGRKFLKLWTTEDPDEATAQILYNKRGFKIVDKEDDVIYKQLDLTSFPVSGF